MALGKLLLVFYLYLSAISWTRTSLPVRNAEFATISTPNNTKHRRPKQLRPSGIDNMDNTQSGDTASASGFKSFLDDLLAGIGAWITTAQVTASDHPTWATLDDDDTLASRPYTSLLQYNGMVSRYLTSKDRAKKNWTQNSMEGSLNL